MPGTLAPPSTADVPLLRARSRRQRPVDDTIVIVGNGMVGHRLCRQLVGRGASRESRIVVFGEEPSPAYDRVHLTDLFEGRTEEDLALATAAWYEDAGIDLVLGDPVAEIDRDARLVRSASGREIRYSALVLATGSRPYIPPVDGASLPGVLPYRTLRDVGAIRDRARTAATAAVIGGGLLGLEAARALQCMGLAVTIVEAAAALLPTQLDQHAGKQVEARISALGIHVVTAAVTMRIEACGPRRTLHLAGGAQLTVDLVVVAAGIRPRGELAGRCGLATTPQGGVVVDDYLRTSDPRIFAIGECASHRSRTYGLVAPGYGMADALAANLTGTPACFRGGTPPTKLKLLEVEVASVGDPLEGRGALRFRAEGTYRVLRLERGRVVGALAVGEWPEFARIQDAVARGARVWPWQAARFERSGTIWARPDERPVTEWPPDAVVCNCLSVTRAQIAAACAGGASSAASVAERTGASTLCGSCRPLLAQLTGGDAPARRVARGLLGISLAAVAAVAILVLAAPIRYGDSWQEASAIEALWRSGEYRRLTGFGTAALAAFASLLTLRKRWRRLSAGPYPAWRLGHALLGVATLVMVCLHTGLRAGDNLSLALMACFAAANVLGAGTGAITAVEHRLGRRGQQYRAGLALLHTVAAWPLPVLIAFHALSAYYF